MKHDVLYSYLIGMQTIHVDQNIFARGIGKDQYVLLPGGNKTLWSFQIPRGKLFDLLPNIPLNNCFIT